MQPIQRPGHLLFLSLDLGTCRDIRSVDISAWYVEYCRSSLVEVACISQICLLFSGFQGLVAASHV